MPAARQEEGKISSHEVGKLLNDVQAMKGKQESIDSKIIAMKQYELFFFFYSR